jgi:hypothetical protein
MAGQLQLRGETGHGRDRLRAYAVFVDGERAGEVREREAASIDVAAGTHEVELRIPWCRSEPLRADFPDGQIVCLRCRPNSNQSALTAITTGRNRYRTVRALRDQTHALVDGTMGPTATRSDYLTTPQATRAPESPVLSVSWSGAGA